MTMISRVLGLVRDIVIARFFGSSAAADAFFVAFKIPNLFRRLFAEGAFSQAFIPVLTEYKEGNDVDRVRALVGATAGVLTFVLFSVVAVGVLAAPAVIAVFAPGFTQDAQKWTLATTLLRITFPYLAFISLTAFLGSLLNTYGRFAIPALTPALLNVALIAAAIIVAPELEEPVMALGFGVFAGGVLQLSMQAIAVSRLGVFGPIRARFSHPGVRQILRLMGPALFGVSVSQINLMIDTLIASLLQTGSISWLYYSDRLMEFPLGVFGIALATVVLPNLSRQHVEGDATAFSETLDWALRLVVLIGLPAAVALAVLAKPMLATIFQYGVMTERDVTMASYSLIAYASGLMAFILIKILAPGFYAKQDTRTPVRIGVIAMVTNVVLNIVLVFPLAHAGLALATSLAAFVNAGLLLRALKANGSYQPQPGWLVFVGKIIIAVVAMCALLMLFNIPHAAWQAGDVVARSSRLGLLVAVGAGGYFLVLLLLGLRPRHFDHRASSA